MKKKIIYIPKSSILNEEQQDINIHDSNQELTKKQPYKKRQQIDHISNNYDKNQENKRQVYQYEKKSQQVSKQASLGEEITDNDISNLSNQDTKKYRYKRREQKDDAFDEQYTNQENQRSIYQQDKNNPQLNKQVCMGEEFNNFESSNQDSRKQYRQKWRQQNVSIFDQQDSNLENKIQFNQYVKKSLQLDKQVSLEQDNIDRESNKQESTKKYQYQWRQQQSAFDQQDFNQDSKRQTYQQNMNSFQMNTQDFTQQENNYVNDLNQGSNKRYQSKWRQQQQSAFDLQDFNQGSLRQTYQQNMNSFQMNTQDSTQQQYNYVNDLNQDSSKRYQSQWRQQKNSIFDQIENNQENQAAVDQKNDIFYLNMIKDKKVLFINNFKIFNACISSMINYELPPILHINLDQIFKKTAIQQLEDNLFQGQVYNLSFSDSYELIFSEKDQMHELQLINAKYLKQYQQTLPEKQLSQTFLQRFPKNTQKLSLKFDQQGNFLQVLQKNKNIAQDKLQQLQLLVKVHLDFSVYENKNLDKEFNYFEILNSIVTLKKLKLTINQSQMFSKLLKQSFENKNFDLTVEIRFRPQNVIDINIFNFLKDFKSVKLKINMSEIDLSIYDISTIYNFFFHLGKNIQTLHFIKNTFKFDSTLQIQQKFLEILKKVLKNLSCLKIDNAFINIDQQAQPEKKNAVQQIIEELSKNYQGNLIISINPHIFLEFSHYFETANFSSLQINFDNDQLDIQLESLKVLSQFTNLDHIKIKITINVENKYQKCFNQLINVLQHFDKRCQLDLTLTFQKAKQRISESLTFQLIKSLLNFSQFSLTWLSNNFDNSKMKNIFDFRLRDQLILTILVLQRLKIKTEYSYNRNHLLHLYDD
ncbi:hypothetical protein ABPG72_015878 [Tetrahymena utriculariae]